MSLLLYINWVLPLVVSISLKEGPA